MEKLPLRPDPPAVATTPVLPSRKALAELPIERRGWPLAAKLAVGMLTAALAALSIALWLEPRRHAPVTEAVGPTILWKALFNNGRRTVIVPGDAALDSYIAWEQRPVSLQSYTNQTYQTEVTVSRPPLTKDVPLSVRSVTPMADLRMAAELTQVQFAMNGDARAEIRYARDLTVSETRNANLILMGSDTFNPWVSVYDGMLDFHVRWKPKTDTYTVEDRLPKAGEPRELVYRRTEHVGRALTTMAYLDNPLGQGNVLLIEGTSMGTTYGALNFLTSPRLWRLAVQAATDEKGHLRSFEVLLANDFVRGGVTNTQLLAIHVHGDTVTP